MVMSPALTSKMMLKHNFLSILKCGQFHKMDHTTHTHTSALELQIFVSELSFNEN